MAKCNTTGIEDIILTMEKLDELPDDVLDELLVAGGEVVKTAQKAKLTSMKLKDTGKLIDSISVFKKGWRKNGVRIRYVLIYPYGDHHDNVTNNEIAFIHEYGAPKRGIKARRWMEKANDSCEELVVEAEEKVYYKWLDTLNL